MMVKEDSDTIAVKQAWRPTNPERTGAQKAPERCYKGKDKAHRIPNVLDALRKDVFL